MRFAILVAAGISIASTSLAQTAVVVPPPIAPTSATLRVGTPVHLKLAEQLSTKEKQVRVGQRFNLEVAEAVMVNGQKVIPAGTPALGEVTEVRNKGMWGKSGHISAHVLYLSLNGRQIRLTGTFDEKGSTGTAGVVGAVAFVPIAGFLMTGTSATMPIGMPINGFVDEDVPLQFSAPAPAAAPLVVPQH